MSGLLRGVVAGGRARALFIGFELESLFWLSAFNSCSRTSSEAPSPGDVTPVVRGGANILLLLTKPLPLTSTLPEDGDLKLGVSG